MKIYILFAFVSIMNISLLAQSPADYFNKAADEYIYKNDQVALNTIDAGLTKYPADVPLSNLKDNGTTSLVLPCCTMSRGWRASLISNLASLTILGLQAFISLAKMAAARNESSLPIN